MNNRQSFDWIVGNLIPEKVMQFSYDSGAGPAIGVIAEVDEVDKELQAQGWPLLVSEFIDVPTGEMLCRNTSVVITQHR
ncbi:hypothetical protein M5J15_04690 [Serratia symbiotica]|uniref:hypothetical protein n=1 Tax=Serratia symbiotica TaxID=138074 RepID=UPI00209137FB|nr:hypothetical protein [Serratia symbiotica]USS96313.1 hypothetical protein M5J15_04690 [Serratia symbiotica]